MVKRKKQHMLKFKFISVVLLVFLLVGWISYSKQNKNHELDLIAGQDWSHLPGAERVGDSVSIKPLGRVITHKDTSAGQSNPPINAWGPKLKVSGDFQIKAKTTGTGNGASLQIYSEMPVIYDEWRQEGKSVRLDVVADAVRVYVWDGSSTGAIDYRQFRISQANDRQLTIRVIDGWLVLLVNKIAFGSIPDHGIFSAGSVIRFGTDARLGGDEWTLTSLRAKGLNGDRVELLPKTDILNVNTDINSLRALASAHPRKMPIGVAASLYPLLTDDKYQELVLGQFSMMTPENEMKPQAIHPQKDTYSFKDADSIIEIAQANKMQVHGHTLVMPKANPHWMERSRDEDRKQIMIDHINTVVGRYKGKVAQWDVVNEPMSEEDHEYTSESRGLRKQMWFDALGEEYIDLAFKTAHAADPSAKLFLNDFGLAEDNIRWLGLIDLVKRLQTRGVPVHGIGFESHVYHKKDSIDPVILKKHIQELAALGLESRISEIDVLGDEEDHQAKQYADVLRVCLSEPSCTSYGTWGVTDLYGSTTISDRYPAITGDSLIWDKKYRAKPAYEALQAVLKGQ